MAKDTIAVSELQLVNAFKIFKRVNNFTTKCRIFIHNPEMLIMNFKQLTIWKIDLVNT